MTPGSSPDLTLTPWNAITSTPPRHSDPTPPPRAIRGNLLPTHSLMKSAHAIRSDARRASNQTESGEAGEAMHAGMQGAGWATLLYSDICEQSGRPARSALSALRAVVYALRHLGKGRSLVCHSLGTEFDVRGLAGI